MARIGIDPPQTLAALWTLATGMVVESCGVPQGLILGKLEGTASRESLRRARVTVLEPILKQISKELQKCGPAPSIPIFGRFGQLVN